MRVEPVTSRDGSRVVVHSQGSGPGIVILHGAGLIVRDYGRLAERLANHGFTVHRYNRRGLADSAPLTGAETVATDVDDLAAVLDYTGAANVFAHSGGGFVAMQAGLSLPLDRIALYDPAVAVAGCDFPKDFVDPFEDAVRAGDEVLAITLMGRDINRDDLTARLPLRLQLLIVRGWVRTPIGRRMAQALPTVLPEVRRILAAEGPAGDYAGIDANVLLAHGARSPGYFKPTCESLADALQRATAMALARASHNSANIAPQRFVRPFAEFFAAPAT